MDGAGSHSDIRRVAKVHIGFRDQSATPSLKPSAAVAEVQLTSSPWSRAYKVISKACFYKVVFSNFYSRTFVY